MVKVKRRKSVMRVVLMRRTMARTKAMASSRMQRVNSQQWCRPAQQKMTHENDQYGLRWDRASHQYNQERTTISSAPSAKP